MMRNPSQTIGNLIDKASLSQLCYIDENSFPVTRAMLPPRERQGISIFWFTTSALSNKVMCLRKDNRASIYFVDRRFFRGVSLSGTVEVLEDAETKHRIWRDGDEKFYAEGVDDAAYCVLKFTASSGRYYSSYRSEDFSVD